MVSEGVVGLAFTEFLVFYTLAISKMQYSNSFLAIIEQLLFILFDILYIVRFISVFLYRIENPPLGH